VRSIRKRESPRGEQLSWTIFEDWLSRGRSLAISIAINSRRLTIEHSLRSKNSLRFQLVISLKKSEIFHQSFNEKLYSNLFEFYIII